MMRKHFVTFYSPGTFVSETNTQEVPSWDIEGAKEIARTIIQRYNATPYAFRFTTRELKSGEFDHKQTAQSPLYYLGGRIETLAEIEARNLPDEEILRSNMRNNGYDRVIVNTNSWKFTGPLSDDDVVLDWPS